MASGFCTSKDSPSQERLGPIVAFSAALVAMLVYTQLSRQMDFRGDVLETWKVARSWWNPDSTFRSYVEYRGSFFFLINATIYRLATILGVDPFLAFRIGGSLLFASLAAISLPNFIGNVSGSTPSIVRRLACVAVVFYFFRGHFLYPSTDAISLWFALMAANSILRSPSLSLSNAAAASFWIAAAVLCRGNFILSIPPLLLVVFRRVPITFSRPSKKGLLYLAALTIPFALLSTASHWFDVERTILRGPTQLSSSKVLTGQLSLGLKNQRIEWRVAGSYPGQPTWIEPTGREILKSEGLGSTWIEPGPYVRLVSRHPLQFAELYARHLFNGLDIAYPAVYIEDVAERSWTFSTLNYALLFWAMILIASQLKTSRNRLLVSSALLAMFLPALACVPFQVEPRFFISLGMPLLAWPTVAGHPKAFRPLMLAGLVVFVLACFTISHQVFKELDGKVPLPFHTIP